MSQKDRDPLLDQLGRLARERSAAEAADEIFERLAHGKLSPQELHALEARAKTDPAVALKLELFRPLGPAAVDRALAALRPVPLPEVTRLPNRRRWIQAGAVGLALAASVALLLWPAQVPSPGYTLTVTGEQLTRGSDPAAGVTVGPGSTLRLIARPATAVTQPVAVHGFLVREGQVRPWVPPMDRAPEGAVKIEGPVETLLPDAPGEYTLVLVLGPAAPTPEQVSQWLTGGPPANVQMLTSRVVRAGP
jgi:hypothetical protein